MQWTDGKIRCHWVSPTNTTYLRYHDEEWGRPVHDDQLLFEMLILENFQAGLTWECVLNKREAFRRAFDGFDLRKVASYSEEKLTALQADSGIIRNRLKIRAAVVSSPLSDAISKDLKKRGMKFVGAVIIYAYLQAVGVINSHESGCFLNPLQQ
ncbi:DNA-3-methyladenine glycosylase I [Lachnospiraceae bacterium AM48-27BH]|nr:DNA-3-methyladenine glycosylase I [Lachnospiraceae bacterium AM48-27BH]